MPEDPSPSPEMLRKLKSAAHETKITTTPHFYCPNCHAELPWEVRFCNKCGTWVTEGQKKALEVKPEDQPETLLELFQLHARLGKPLPTHADAEELLPTTAYFKSEAFRAGWAKWREDLAKAAKKLEKKGAVSPEAVDEAIIKALTLLLAGKNPLLDDSFSEEDTSTWFQTKFMAEAFWPRVEDLLKKSQADTPDEEGTPEKPGTPVAKGAKPASTPLATPASVAPEPVASAQSFEDLLETAIDARHLPTYKAVRPLLEDLSPHFRDDKFAKYWTNWVETLQPLLVKFHEKYGAVGVATFKKRVLGPLEGRHPFTTPMDPKPVKKWLKKRYDVKALKKLLAEDFRLGAGFFG